MRCNFQRFAEDDRRACRDLLSVSYRLCYERKRMLLRCERVCIPLLATLRAQRYRRSPILKNTCIDDGVGAFNRCGHCIWFGNKASHLIEGRRWGWMAREDKYILHGTLSPQRFDRSCWQAQLVWPGKGIRKSFLRFYDSLTHNTIHSIPHSMSTHYTYTAQAIFYQGGADLCACYTHQQTWQLCAVKHIWWATERFIR